MNAFFEFFIERLLWVWLPLYAFYRVMNDILNDLQEKKEGK
jgi:hypothetical protein